MYLFIYFHILFQHWFDRINQLVVSDRKFYPKFDIGPIYSRDGDSITSSCFQSIRLDAGQTLRLLSFRFNTAGDQTSLLPPFLKCLTHTGREWRKVDVLLYSPTSVIFDSFSGTVSIADDTRGTTRGGGAAYIIIRRFKLHFWNWVWESTVGRAHRLDLSACVSSSLMRLEVSEASSLAPSSRYISNALDAAADLTCHFNEFSPFLLSGPWMMISGRGWAEPVRPPSIESMMVDIPMSF